MRALSPHIIIIVCDCAARSAVAAEVHLLAARVASLPAARRPRADEGAPEQRRAGMLLAPASAR